MGERLFSSQRLLVSSLIFFVALLATGCTTTFLEYSGKMANQGSTNHVEPYQGAATGVGGILRDIFTMGARPVASMNSLKFGAFDHPRTRYLLGGVVGVSRVVTSEGWRPHSQQVGQTGTKITPELYLACGISGAIQHIAGCASAKHIVAVNKDAGAPILAHAEYAVIGDLHEVIPARGTAIRDRGASSS